MVAVFKAPKPTFFTHSTSKLGYDGIRKKGLISSDIRNEGDFVPVSLDGGIVISGIPVWGNYIFSFPLEQLLSLKTRPVFYLGTNDFLTTEDAGQYLVMDMVSIFATEVQILGTISISSSRRIPLILPTLLSSFLAPTWPELKAHAKGVSLGKPLPSSYSPLLLSIVTGYNVMLASLFRINYDRVKTFAASKALDNGWEVWWRK